MSRQEASSSEKLYWPQLDGLRCLAFFLVFISHLVPIPILRVSTAVDSCIQFWNTLAGWGWIGVELFFVLSAFLITTLLLREREKYGNVSFRDFFIRRVLRIWPLYYFFILLVFFLIPLFSAGTLSAALGTSDWYLLIKKYLSTSLLFLFNFSLMGSQTSQFFQRIHWSVAMEEQFYVVWGWALSKIKQTSIIYKLVPIGLVSTLIIRFVIWSMAPDYTYYYYNTLSHLDSILIGMGTAFLISEGKLQPQKIQKRGHWLLVLPTLFYLSLCFFAPPIQSNTLLHVFIFLPVAFFSGVLLLAVLYGKIGQAIFSHPLVVRVGQITYGMYLFHMLGQLMALKILKAFFQQIHGIVEIYQAWALYAVVAFLLTWLMAFLSWQLLEKRFYNLRYRFSRIPSGFDR